MKSKPKTAAAGPKKTAAAPAKKTAAKSRAKVAPKVAPRPASAARRKKVPSLLAGTRPRASEPPASEPPPSVQLGEASPPRIEETGSRVSTTDRASSPQVVAQMRELEAQLDRLIERASHPDLSELDEEDVDEAPAPAPAPAPEVRARAPEEEEPAPLSELPVPSGPGREPLSIPYARPSGPLPSQVAPVSERAVFDTARELLSTDFYLRKWGRLAMRNRSEEVDDFGYDPIYDEKVRPALDFLYTKYFRIEASGVDRIPAAGRCLLVANHSGTVPLDGVMIKTAVRREHPAHRHVRWLTEDFIYHFPYLGGAMNRLGAVRACQENAERLLANDELVAVFPEGVKGIGKLFAQRYRLQRFGRGGFIKLGLRTSTPIVPVAVVGAEETNPLLFRIEHLAKIVGLPYVPVTPTFPLLGPAGLLPAPTKWKMIFGEPIDFSSYGPEAADDELLVGKLAERVRANIQGMLDREIGSRKSVFFG